jgi:hypothetical protein
LQEEVGALRGGQSQRQKATYQTGSICRESRDTGCGRIRKIVENVLDEKRQCIISAVSLCHVLARLDT